MEGQFPVLLGAGLILLLLFLAGYIGLKIRIPGVVVFILVGVVLGGILSDHKLLHIAGEVGIILLFFLLGLEFPIKRLADIAKRVLPAGMLDVVLSLGVTMGIAYLFGLDWVTAFMIGGVVYATSSSITVKLLESSKRMANPESEFMLAVLIFEDIVAPIVVTLLVALTAGNGLTGLDFIWILIKVILLMAGAIVLGRLLFAKLGPFFERYVNQDLFILFLVGIALSYGGLALYMELSEVLGAFLAGIMLAEARRTEVLEPLILPVRDLFLPLFFVYFGTTIALGEKIPYLGLLLILLAWSIIAKILVCVIGGRWYGLSKKVALRAGFSFTQRGEFSVIIASLASGPFVLFSGLFILFSALIGIVLFQFAPKITRYVYGQR
ncbi:CPA2 family monovalent cation:H+ antiporter-2 [Caldalkalibacillus uzonensis]|uniref:CPA2 family monovalent cation:H+ antiporter-2 n=1 Tax=Caldalkalibacillus uzonensis TaxID=353224 RepID=A0ABU0CT25_9BACI|nr:cation:proton antiporter [Caldalkalibacillus uzonensis]MDQ0339258.1 CPA2 family monovalent cation:H+ antiporter-2 [Caldalkalibacillus uzonensis]